MEFLKVVVLNNSGNVGKSTLTSAMLEPRFKAVAENDVEVIKVETINNDGTTDETIAAKNLVKVQGLIDLADIAIVDVGSSNIEQFMNNLEKTDGAIDDFDYFIIPTIPKTKQQLDTIATIENLLNLGVDADCIKLVFNFADESISLTDQFSEIFNNSILKEIGLESESHASIVYENQVFSLLSKTNKTFVELLDDDRDFKTLLRSTKDKDERAKLSQDRAAHRLAVGFNKKLDTAFNKLNLI